MSAAHTFSHLLTPHHTYSHLPKVMLFPNHLRSLVPHARTLAGLYCYGTGHYGAAESHFAASFDGHTAEGPRTAAATLRACAILAQVGMG